MRLRLLPVLLMLLLSFAVGQQPQPDKPKPEAAKPEVAKVEVPQLDAGIGPCTADFTVTDAAGKPVYSAKIHTLIRYGAFAVRKTDLELSTNYEGHARIIGLPDANKRPTQFDVSKDSVKRDVPFEPGVNCHPHYDVVLK